MLEANLRIIFDKILGNFENPNSQPPVKYLTHEDIPLKWFDSTSCSACYSLCFVYELPSGDFKVLVDHGAVAHQGGEYHSRVNEVICTTLKEVYDVLMSEQQYDGNTTSDNMDVLEHYLAIGAMYVTRNETRVIPYQADGFEHLSEDVKVNYKYTHRHGNSCCCSTEISAMKRDSEKYINKMYIYADGKSFLEILGELSTDDINAIFDSYYDAKHNVICTDGVDMDC